MCAISISTCIYPSSRATNVSNRGRLARAAQEQGGLIIALDGLAPQGGEPQIWFIRDLSTGLTLRSGWLAQLDQPTFEAFSSPPGSTWSGQFWPCSATSKRVWCRL